MGCPRAAFVRKEEFATIRGSGWGWRREPAARRNLCGHRQLSCESGHALTFATRLILFASAALPLCLAGCVKPWTSPQRVDLPDRYTIVRDQLVIHADFEVPARHRLLDELTARREDMRRELAYASTDEPIHVYLFEDADRFRQFVREEHPDFPNRRAFFVETDTRLEVYAHWGGYVGEDLRDEVAHAYLHSVLPNIPLWLDEGLAEYFEVPRGRNGLNRDQLAQILSQEGQGARRRISRRRVRSARCCRDLQTYASGVAQFQALSAS